MLQIKPKIANSELKLKNYISAPECSRQETESQKLFYASLK